MSTQEASLGMADSQSIFTVGTFISAFIGAAIGVFLDRLWRRMESVPLFRIQVGFFSELNVGEGISLTIENVGLDPIPAYGVWLFHPDRGSLGVFHANPTKLVFPQYPQQKNEFRCVTKPDSSADSSQEMIHRWLHRVRDKEVGSPHFVNFSLRLVLRNSDQVLFEDQGLGNYLAQKIYEDITGKGTEQPVEVVYYRSKAPFWVEVIRNYRIRRMIRRAEKEKTK